MLSTETNYILRCTFQINKTLIHRQGTFLHQARRAKVQERRQQETLDEILFKKVLLHDVFRWIYFNEMENDLWKLQEIYILRLKPTRF